MVGTNHAASCCDSKRLIVAMTIIKKWAFARRNTVLIVFADAVVFVVFVEFVVDIQISLKSRASDSQRNGRFVTEC